MRLENTLRAVHENSALTEGLRVCGRCCVLLSVYDFVYLCVLSFAASPMRGVRTLVFLAVPFLLVSLFRHLIHAPRPYELYAVYETPPGKKKGRSFPSRHAFCAFVLATVLLPYSALLAILSFGAGTLLSVCRVLLGIHFPRDVLAGGLIGILAGGIALWLI